MLFALPLLPSAFMEQFYKTADLIFAGNSIDSDAVAVIGMRNWEASCKSAGANLACDPVICNDAPDEEAVTSCKALGAALA